MYYEFRTTVGRVCCSTNNPEHLCPKCRARLIAAAGEPPKPLDRDTPPDPYASARKQKPCPYDTKGYQPHGQPPDPYRPGRTKGGTK